MTLLALGALAGLCWCAYRWAVLWQRRDTLRIQREWFK